MRMHPFTQFIRFVEADLSLMAHEQQQKLLTQEIEQLTVSINQEQERLEKLKANVQSMRKHMYSLEVEGRIKQDRGQEITLLLDRITNPKEYTALSRELEELARTRAANEDLLIETWQAYEAAQLDYDKQYHEFKEWLLAQEQAIVRKEGTGRAP